MGTDIPEFRAKVLEHQNGFFVLHPRGHLLHHIVWMAVGKKKIGIAIVVIIEKLQPPAAQQTSRWTNLARLVGEGEVLLVVVEAEQLLIDVGDKQILPAVAVKVRGIHTHTRTGGAVITEGYARP